MNHPVLKFLVSFSVIAVVFYFIDHNLDEYAGYFAQALQNTDRKLFSLLGTLFTLQLIAFSLKGVRWQLMLPPEARPELNEALGGFWWCFLIGYILPFRLGEFSRLGWLKTRGYSLSSATASLLAERVSDLLLIALFLSLGIFLQPRMAELIAIPTNALLLLASAFLCIGLLFSVKRVRSNGFIQQLSTSLVTALSNRTAFTLTVFSWCLPLVGFGLLLTFGFNLAFVAAFSLIAALNLSSLFTIVPGNLGVYEAVGILILSSYSVPSNEALFITLLLHLSSFGATLFGGLLGRFYLFFHDRPNEKHP